MTRKRVIGKDEPFEAWLRAREDLRSGLGYIRTDLDVVWFDYNRCYLMLIEKKTHQKGALNDNPNIPQDAVHDIVHQAFMKTHGEEFYFPVRKYWGKLRYYGKHFLQFEKEGPLDGKMWLDGKLISKTELVAFLKFEGHS